MWMPLRTHSVWRIALSSYKKNEKFIAREKNANKLYNNLQCTIKVRSFHRKHKMEMEHIK